MVSGVERASRGTHGGTEVSSAHSLSPICLPRHPREPSLITYLIAAKYQRMCGWVPDVLTLGRNLSVPGATQQHLLQCLRPAVQQVPLEHQGHTPRRTAF